MSSMLEKSSAIFKIVYNSDKEKTIKILDTYFVFQNKRKCRLIINNKLHLLTDKLRLKDNNQKILKIKFLIMNDKN